MQLAKHKTEGNVKLMWQLRGPFTVHMANKLMQHPGGVSEMEPSPKWRIQNVFCHTTFFHKMRRQVLEQSQRGGPQWQSYSSIRASKRRPGQFYTLGSPVLPYLSHLTQWLVTQIRTGDADGSTSVLASLDIPKEPTCLISKICKDPWVRYPLRA